MQAGGYSIQIDFSNVVWGTNGTKVRLLYFISYTNATNYTQMIFENFGGTTIAYRAQTITDGVVSTTDSAVKTDTSGKLRIRYSGTITYLEYWDNISAWVTLRSKDSANHQAPAYFYIRTYQTGTSSAATTNDWDNLVINSGTISKGYYKDSPEVVFNQVTGCTAVDWSTFASTEGGTGSVKYKRSLSGGAYSGWLTKAALIALGVEACSYFDLTSQLISDGTQTVTLDDLTVDYTPASITAQVSANCNAGDLWSSDIDVEVQTSVAGLLSTLNQATISLIASSNYQATISDLITSIMNLAAEQSIAAEVSSGLPASVIVTATLSLLGEITPIIAIKYFRTYRSPFLITRTHKNITASLSKKNIAVTLSDKNITGD